MRAAVKAAAPRPPPPCGPASAEPKRRLRKIRSTGPAKLFVLDTNVLMHDPMSLFRFEEHDVFLPMITLEELDNHKKGMSEVARNARQVSRELDGLASLHRQGRHARPELRLGIPNWARPATAKPAASCSSRPR